MIIIPDIHARNFWKTAIEGHENEEIIFLGDYVDPYVGYEPTQQEDVIPNLLEIIQFKREHMDNVTLLVGNHDLGGYIIPRMTKCRFDYERQLEIREIFYNNIELFNIGYIKIINDKPYVFTHAGFIKDWLKVVSKNIQVEDITNYNDIVATLNSFLHKKDWDNLEVILDWMSRYRGGWGWYGSCVWSDVYEHLNKKPLEGIFQIFGHSQQEKDPIITEDFAMLDCRRAFVLSEEDGKIKELDGTDAPLFNKNYN